MVPWAWKGHKSTSFTIGAFDFDQFKSNQIKVQLLFEHDLFRNPFPPSRDHDLVAGEHLDLGVDAGNDLEDALIRLVVVAGDGTILAFREDHAREGAR